MWRFAIKWIPVENLHLNDFLTMKSPCSLPSTLKWAHLPVSWTVMNVVLYVTAIRPLPEAGHFWFSQLTHFLVLVVRGQPLIIWGAVKINRTLQSMTISAFIHEHISSPKKIKFGGSPKKKIRRRKYAPRPPQMINGRPLKIWDLKC